LPTDDVNGVVIACQTLIWTIGGAVAAHESAVVLAGFLRIFYSMVLRV
jgi:hypothetical protein